MPRDHETALVNKPPENVSVIVDNSPNDALIGVCDSRYAPVSVYIGFVDDAAPDAGAITIFVVIPTKP